MAPLFAPVGYLPRHMLGVIREVGRHVLRRPVVGICAVARNPRGEVLLVRRSDMGTWALPGGTLGWGETLTAALGRELVVDGSPASTRGPTAIRAFTP
jgi:8-oxo-dGTP diphosphatase